MKPPSLHQLKTNYARINRIAFGGNLPPVKMIEWDKINLVHKNGSRGISCWKKDEEYGRFISLNLKMLPCRTQWRLTLIHEMVHYEIPQICNTEMFQQRVLEVALKMRWCLL